MIITIHCSKNSKRLSYILSWLFEERLNVEIHLIHNLNDIENTNILIHYGPENIPEATLNIYSCGLLFETKLTEKEIKVYWENGWPYFFHTDESYDLSFDIFSMCFYCISRYEEYVYNQLDQHKRWVSSQSLAVKENFIHLPILDYWIGQLVHLINRIDNSFTSDDTYRIIPTIDIDLPYAYKTKAWKNILALLRDGSLGKLNKVRSRIGFLINKQDPFDSYDYLLMNLSDYPNSLFFFLCKWQKPYDENFLVDHSFFSDLVKKIAKYHAIGIHPSYSGDGELDAIQNELKILSDISGEKIEKSRQHFLKFSIPKTYRNLVSSGLLEDHSMIYPDKIGFRASTSHSFYWYDLNNESVTNLRIFSPCLMDVTLKNYLKLSPIKAKEEIKKLKSTVSKLSGNFEFIWHNSSFSPVHGWKLWTSVFEELIKKNE